MGAAGTTIENSIIAVVDAQGKLVILEGGQITRIWQSPFELMRPVFQQNDLSRTAGSVHMHIPIKNRAKVLRFAYPFTDDQFA